jgi:hypothetical protein
MRGARRLWRDRTRRQARWLRTRRQARWLRTRREARLRLSVNGNGEGGESEGEKGEEEFGHCGGRWTRRRGEVVGKGSRKGPRHGG